MVLETQAKDGSETQGGLVRPDVTPAQAEQIVVECFGVNGVATELGSNQDRNFKIAAATGEKYVLRVDNPVFKDETREAQHAAIAACAEAGIRVPGMITAKSGGLTGNWGGYSVRLSEFVSLTPMVDLGYFSPHVIAEFGLLAAKSVLALKDVAHEGVERDHQWDMRVAHSETMQIAGSIADPVLRERVIDAANKAAKALDPLTTALAVQPIHGDLTDDNVMGEKRPDARVYPAVMIDFGDFSSGWRIAELAVCMTSLLHHTDADPLRGLEALRAFASHLKEAKDPITQAEALALWPLVQLRAALLVANGHHQLAIEGDNDYVRERIAGEQEIFDTATKYGLREMTEQVLVTLGLLGEPAGAGLKLVATPQKPATASTELASLIAGLGAVEADVAVIDLGVEAEALAAGAWLEDDIESRLVAEAFQAGAKAVVLPYGVFRLTRAAVDKAHSQKTFALDTEIFIGKDAFEDSVANHAKSNSVRVMAPVAGEVVNLKSVDSGVSVASAESGESAVNLGSVGVTGSANSFLAIKTLDGFVFEVSGDLDGTPVVGATVNIGDEIASLKFKGATVRLAVGLYRESAHKEALLLERQAPGHARFAEPERASAWRRLSVDPATLLGLESYAARDESGDEQARREKVFAAAQERYYEKPMQIERGWQHHLIDTTGRSYIDMVNNVTGLGHGHPGVADAVNKQMRLLGTNSRFLYRSLAEYSERLLELVPKDLGLDTVLLVNSGSEAVDLALRLAQAATSRKTVVSLREAYHGWTMASDAVTTSAFDNPYALETRPDWVHVADVPNTYRGTHRGADAGQKYASDLQRDLNTLAAAGNPVAAFICESVLGNAGGVMLPEGYLESVYESVREAGGLVIADEIQVGFGRMGSSFWGFEQSGVKPDIITIAKPMGNGFPIGGVITSKKIADALATQGQFFSSAGGNPVSCQVGLAVLDAMRDEGLQENARLVGAHLKRGFEELAERHEIIGMVHGEGLYLGVELVRDRESLEPAKEEADAICERLRELGVIMLTTSERSNVLKIKPPLTLTIESADEVLTALDSVLSFGF